MWYRFAKFIFAESQLSQDLKYMLQSDKTKKFEELDEVEKNAITAKLNRINDITLGLKPKLKYLAARYLDQAPEQEIKLLFEEIPEAFINGLNTNRNNITYKLGNQPHVLPTDYLEFSQIIHALTVPKTKQVVEEEEINLDSLENPIEIFDINSAADSMKFYSILPWKGRQWCITWPPSRGNQWWPYRQNHESTFYIVVDNTLQKSNPFYAVAVDHTKTGLKITDLRNGLEQSYFKEYPELAGTDKKPRSYNDYLLDVHKIDSSRFPFKPLTQEEKDAYNFFSKERNTLDEFKELFSKQANDQYENAPLKYIQFPKELTDEQFKYLIDIKREDLVRAYLNGVFLVNDYKFSLLNNNYKTTYDRKENKLIEEANEKGKLKNLSDSAQRTSTLDKILNIDPDCDMSDKLLDSIKSNNLEMTKYIIKNTSNWKSKAFAEAKDIDMIEFLWHNSIAPGLNAITFIGIAIKNFSEDLIENSFNKEIFERLINLDNGIHRAKDYIRMGGSNSELIRNLYTQYDLGVENFFSSDADAVPFIEECAINDLITFKFILENELDRAYYTEFEVNEDSYRIAKEDFKFHEINNDELQENHFFNKIDVDETLKEAIANDNLPFVKQLVEDKKYFFEENQIKIWPQSIAMASFFEKIKKEDPIDVFVSWSIVIENAVRNWDTSSLKWLSKNFDKPQLDLNNVRMIGLDFIKDNPVSKLQLLINTYKFPLKIIDFRDIIQQAFKDNNLKLMQVCSAYSENSGNFLYAKTPPQNVKLEILKFVHENLNVSFSSLGLEDYVEGNGLIATKEKIKIMDYLIKKGYFNEDNLNTFNIGVNNLELYKELQFPIQNLDVKRTIEELPPDPEYLKQALSLIKNYNEVDGVQLFNKFVAKRSETVNESVYFTPSEKERIRDDLRIKFKDVQDSEKIKILLLNGFNENTLDFNSYFKTLYLKGFSRYVENTEIISEMFKTFKANNWYRNVSIRIPTERMSKEEFLKFVKDYEVPVKFINIFEADGLIERYFFSDKFEFLNSIREYILEAMTLGYSPKYSVALLGSKGMIEIFENKLEFLIDFNSCFDINSEDFLENKLGFIKYLSINYPDALVEMLNNCLHSHYKSLTIPLKINAFVPENVKNKLAEKSKIYKDFTQNDFSNFYFEVIPDNYPLYRNLILEKKISADEVFQKCDLVEIDNHQFYIVKDLLKLGANPEKVSRVIFSNFTDNSIRRDGGNDFFTFLKQNYPL